MPNWPGDATVFPFCMPIIKQFEGFRAKPYKDSAGIPTIGYGTIHGDMACAINPMGDLYKTQVRQLAAYLEIPETIRRKKPTAGLWAGQTDEDELGLTYAELDEILFHLVDEREGRGELLARGLAAKKVDRVMTLIRSSEFKRQLPPIAKLSARTIGHDFLYPSDWSK